MSQEKNLEALLEHFTEMGPPGCGLIVTSKGKEIFSHCTGYADVASKEVLTRDHLVKLYSVTKVFTSIALLTLYEKGKFLLNDPLETYLPEFANPTVGVLTGNGYWLPKPTRSITVKDLFTMSAGLTYNPPVGTGPFSPTHVAIGEAVDALLEKGAYTVRDFTKAISEVPLWFEPGTGFSYGYCLDIAGALIEVLSDMTFEDYLAESIYKPLGLKDTTFWVTDENRNRLATKYTVAEETGELVVLEGDLPGIINYDSEKLFMGGGGGLISTLDEVSRFANILSMGGSLDGTRIIGRKTIDMMRQNHLNKQQLESFKANTTSGWPELEGYGYGLGVRTMIDTFAAGSNGTVGEFGWYGLTGTYVLIDPDEQLSISYVQQVMPNIYASYCLPRINNVCYALLS